MPRGDTVSVLQCHLEGPPDVSVRILTPAPMAASRTAKGTLTPMPHEDAEVVFRNECERSVRGFYRQDSHGDARRHRRLPCHPHASWTCPRVSMLRRHRIPCSPDPGSLLKLVLRLTLGPRSSCPGARAAFSRPSPGLSTPSLR